MSITFSQIQKILASDGQSSDFFGNKLAISSHGHMAFVGNPFDTISVSNQGSVYFFLCVSDSWNFQQKLFLSDAVANNNDRFGSAIAISADSSTLIVGVPQFSTVTAGEVYIYTNSDNFWIQQTSLSVPTSDGRFGEAVGLSQDGNIAAIGAPRYGDRAGIVHIFNRIVSGLGTSWVYQAQIPSPGSDHLFGSAISLSADGSTLLIGAVGRSKSYVFVNSDNTWVKQSDFGNGVSDAFGSSVALSFVGDIALIGAPGHNSDQGAVYLYTRSDEMWSAQYQLQLSSSDTLISDARLGASVALGLGIDGRATALVGAPGANAAYVFKSGKESEWTHFQEITASDTLSSVNFGNAVALSGSGLVAIVADSGLASDMGSAYVFSSPADVILANASASAFMSYLPDVVPAIVLSYVGIAIMFLFVAFDES